MIMFKILDTSLNDHMDWYLIYVLIKTDLYNRHNTIIFYF